MIDIYTDFAPDCDAFLPLLDALGDNELTARDADQARRHLETCAACREAFAGNAQVRAAAQSWTVDSVGERDVWVGVQARIAAESGKAPTLASRNTPAPSFITAAQLLHAQYVSQTRAGGVGETLVELSYSAERDVAKARAIAEAIPFVDLTKHAPEASAISVVPADVAFASGALPIKKDRNRLWVAFRNPRDINAVDAVRFASGCLVQPMYAAPSDLERAMAQAYPLAPPSAPVASVATGADEAAELDKALRTIRELRAEFGLLQAETASLRREIARLKARSENVPAPQTPLDFFAPVLSPLDLPTRRIQ